MSNYLVKGLAHIGILAEDARACADFYIKHLNFRYQYEHMLGDLLLVFVECGGCVVEFVQTGGLDHGGVVDHIALEVQGIEAMVKKLKEDGIVFETEEIGRTPDFGPNGMKNIFFKGPAGERIELFDYSK